MSKYDEVLKPFVQMMETELHANAGKGDRPGWLLMSADTCLLEIYYHLSKLQKSVKDDNGKGIREYAADVANMSMMLVDICGELFLDTENIHLAGSVEVLGRKNWQDECLKRGFEYVRESDDHYVTATPEQMADLLREVLGIDVRRPQGCDYPEPSPVPPAGDVEVPCSIQGHSWPTDSEPKVIAYVDESDVVVVIGESAWRRKAYVDFGRAIPDAWVKLVDRAHVTRLTAEVDRWHDLCVERTTERDGLHQLLEQKDSVLKATEELWDTAQSELTKAQELLRWFYSHSNVAQVGTVMMNSARDYLHTVDESCGQDSEAAKGGA